MRLLLIMILLSLPIVASAQEFYTVSGTITSGDTQQPLPGANVYITNTMIGTQSGPDGSFELNNLPRGRFTLIISFIGYESLKLEIETHHEDVYNGVLNQCYIFKIENNTMHEDVYNVVLKPAATTLHEIVVSGQKRSDWLKSYTLFVKNFIGLSDNSSKCRIVNPHSLHFTFREGILNAFADSVVVVENRGLGYRLKFELEKYSFNNLTNSLFYKGQVLYEQLKPESEKQRLLWAQNRLKAYRGSEMHFLRALYNKRTLEEGFIINLFKGGTDKDGKPNTIAIADTVLRVPSELYKKPVKMPTLKNYTQILDLHDSTAVLSYKGYLEVTYVHESETAAYLNTKKLPPSPLPFQKSRLTLLVSKAAVEPNGTLYPEESVESRNYWSWELVSESLPIDYDPVQDLKIVDAH